MAYIDIQNVTYTYPLTKTPSIADVNLSFERGKFYAILGANGSGKTTLCNIIRGFIPNFFQGEMKGKVIIDGKNLEEYEMGEIASKIGYVFQNYNLINDISVYDGNYQYNVLAGKKSI